jgi:hypothetical protein
MKPGHAPKFGAISDFDQRNAANVAAWTYLRAVRATAPDYRDADLVRRGLDAAFRMSQARAWIEVRRREVDAWRGHAARKLCRVIAFPARGLRR